MAAERLADWSNDADFAGSISEMPSAGGFARVGRLVDGDQLKPRLQPFENHLARDDVVELPGTGRIQRHEFDEAQADILLPGKGGQVLDLVVVDPADDDGVYFNWPEPECAGEVDAFEYAGMAIAAGHAFEILWIHGIHAETHALKASLPEGFGLAGEQESVGRQREVFDARDRRQLAHELFDTLPEKRFPAGDSQLSDA